MTLLVSLAFATNQEEGKDDRSVNDQRLDSSPTFVGNGGAIHLAVKDKYIELKWVSLVEVSQNGAAVHSEDLSSHHYSWSGVKDQDLEDENGQHSGHQFPQVNFSTQLTNGAWFNVSAWVVTVDVTIRNTTVKRNSVKFNLYISNWTFHNSSDVLQLTADVNGHGGDDGEAHEDGDVHNSNDKNETGKNETGKNETAYHQQWQEKRLLFAIGYITSPNQGTYDGSTSGPVTVTHTLSGKPTITWTFGSFHSSVSYDPVVAPNAGFQILPSIFLLILLSLSAFFVGSN